MTTITIHTDGQPTVDDLSTRKMIQFAEIDFAKNPAAAADVVQVLNIPAGAIVTRVCAVVKTAEGAAATATVGDASGANSWDASLDLNAASYQSSIVGTDAYANGKYYATADTIDLTLGHAVDAAIVCMIAEYMIVDPLR